MLLLWQDSDLLSDGVFSLNWKRPSTSSLPPLVARHRHDTTSGLLFPHETREAFDHRRHSFSYVAGALLFPPPIFCPKLRSFCIGFPQRQKFSWGLPFESVREVYFLSIQEFFWRRLFSYTINFPLPSRHSGSFTFP